MTEPANIRSFAFSLILLLSLSGCGVSDIYVPNEPVTIHFAHPGPAEYYGPLVEEFERTHENVTVELTSRQFRDFDAWMENDVITVNQGWLPNLVDEGYGVSLNAYISEDEAFDQDDVYPSAVTGLSIQGQVWALPYMADMLVMFYNRDLFDKYRVPYPDAAWTWDSFLETAQQLTHESAGEYGYAPQQLGGDRAFFETMALIYQHGGRLFDDLGSPDRVTFNEPLTVEALQWYADVFHQHKVAPIPGARQMPYPLAGIEGGKYAMWVGFLDDTWGDVNVAVAPLPRGSNAATFGSVTGLMITTEADDPQACWQWLTFVTQYAPPGLVPVRRSLMETDRGHEPLPGAFEAVQVSLPNLLVPPFNMQQELYRNWGFVTEAYTTALSKIQSGEPVKAALDEAQDFVDANY